MEVLLYSDIFERMQKTVKNFIAREGTFRLYRGSNQIVNISTAFPCVEIRRWYVFPATAELLPIKNGIALKVDYFQELCDRLKDLNEDIADMDAVIQCQITC